MLDLQRLAGNSAVVELLGVQRSVVDELGISPAKDRLARALDDDHESDAITAFAQLDAAETDSVLRSDRWRDLATGSFDNAEMHRAMIATDQKGLLWNKLIWEFDEGTNWSQLRALIVAAPTPQRSLVMSEGGNWFRDQFVGEVGNHTMGEAVRSMGPPLRHQLDWMIEEGVDRQEFEWLIEESSPSEIYAASGDAGLMARLREEVGRDSGVVTALEAARRIEPTGTTPVGPRWTEADRNMLAAQAAKVGVIDVRMAARAPGAVAALADADYAAFRALLAGAGSDAERAFILKALATGHAIGEVTTFATTIRGMTDAWLIQNLNVLQITSTTDTAGGTGIIQQFGNSCGPTSVQVLRAEADPIYALSLNSAGPVGQASPTAVTNPTTIPNTAAAGEQGAILDAHVADGTGNAPLNRATPGGGAWVETDMNARRQATGVEYTRRDIGSDLSVDQALAILTISTGMGIDVPIIVGSRPGEFAHYVVVIRKDGDRYQIHDVWAGQTVWRTATDFRTSRLNLPSNHMAISALAEPRLVT
ncbi:MAG: hypothetical protein WCK58_09330 [Chloroflexota bacterium]